MAARRAGRVHVEFAQYPQSAPTCARSMHARAGRARPADLRRSGRDALARIGAAGAEQGNRVTRAILGGGVALLAPRICSVLPGGRRSKLIWALCYLCHPHSRRPNEPSQRRCYGSRRGMSPRGRPTELQQRLYDLRPPNPRAAHSPRSAKISRGATPSAMRSMNSHGGSARSPRGLSGPGRRFRRGRAGRNRRGSSGHPGEDEARPGAGGDEGAALAPPALPHRLASATRAATGSAGAQLHSAKSLPSGGHRDLRSGEIQPSSPTPRRHKRGAPFEKLSASIWPVERAEIPVARIDNLDRRVQRGDREHLVAAGRAAARAGRPR